MSTDDMLTWLRERLDRAEELAQYAKEGTGGGVWMVAEYASCDCCQILRTPNDTLVCTLDDRYSDHVALHDPVSVLRSVLFAREIIADHTELGIEGECARCVVWDTDSEGELVADSLEYPCRTVVSLAKAWGWSEGSNG